MAEIYTVGLHSSYTAENWHVMCNENNVMQKFYHPLRMTVLQLNEHWLSCPRVVRWAVGAPSVKAIPEKPVSFPAGRQRRWRTKPNEARNSVS